MAFIVDKKYIIDESVDYDFGELRILLPEVHNKTSFGPVEDTPDDDDDDDEEEEESPSSNGNSFDKGAGFKGFISSARLDKMLKRLKPKPSKCFQCETELIGPYCFTCGIKFTGEEKVFRRV